MFQRLKDYAMTVDDASVWEGVRLPAYRMGATQVAAKATRPAPISPYSVGDPVVKVTGYPFLGKIVAIFSTSAGHVRYVVEATGSDYLGMLHIFNGEQIASAVPAKATGARKS